MSKKIIITIIVLLVVIVGMGLFAKKDKKDIYTQTPQENTAGDQSKPTNQQTNTSESAKSYTLAEVAAHKTENDCWTVINGKVYDITKTIPTHPAGKEKIMKGCGIDATSIFTKVPKHDLALLSSNIIGDLK